MRISAIHKELEALFVPLITFGAPCSICDSGARGRASEQPCPFQVTRCRERAKAAAATAVARRAVGRGLN